MAPDGTIYAFDPTANAVSRFSSTGEFIDRHRMEFGFSKMDDLAAGSDGRLAIAGITPRGPAPDSAIHVFDSDLLYSNSFASVFVVGRREGTSRFWDLFTRSGRHLATTSVPGDWGVMVGYDSTRRVLRVLGQHQFEPVLRRLRLDPTGL